MTPVVILDGGMGQELIRRRAIKPHPLWSTQVMMDAPDLVRAVHADFIRAGATVITLNTYSTTPERLASHNLADQFEAMQRTAFNLARQARDECGHDVLIAGCLPPLVASYCPEEVPDDVTLRSTWRRIVELQAPHVDLFIAETLTTVREARIAAQVIVACALPAWVGLTVADRRGCELRSGESLAAGANAAWDAGAQAVLVNCSWPEAVPAALPALAENGGWYGAYANGFTGISALKKGGTVDTLRARTDISPTVYADHGEKWLAQGARIVGGCCEIGPDHIRALRHRVESLGYAPCGGIPETEAQA